MVDRRSPEQEQVLNDLWNDLVRASGAQDATEDPLDPELVETIRYLHDLGATPPPTSSRERVRRSLQASASSKFAPKEVDMFSQTEVFRPQAIAANGWRPAQPAEPRRSRLIDWPRAYLAAAAVLLIVLGSIAVAYRYSGDSGPSRGGPAILAPATPSPTGETLLEITLPAEIVPHTSDRHVGLSHEAYGPKSHAVWDPYCCDGPIIQYQLTGTITVRAEAPVQIVRANGSTDDILANTDATVNPGDALIVLNQVRIETTNDGSEPAEVLSWAFIDEPNDKFHGRTGQAGMAGQYVLDTAYDRQGSIVPIPGSATVRIQRVALEAGEQIEMPESSTMLVATLDPVTESVIRAGDGSYIKASNSRGEPTTTVYVVILAPGATSPNATPDGS
jgi:hypothetical protein